LRSGAQSELRIETHDKETGRRVDVTAGSLRQPGRPWQRYDNELNAIELGDDAQLNELELGIDTL
jgi:hypothetical protein